MTKILNNKVVIISDFINPIIPELMSMHGARLVVNFDSNYSKDFSFQNEFANKIKSIGGEVYITNETISDFSSSKNVIDFAIDKYGSIDVVFCSKDFKQTKTIEDMKESDWDKIYSENLKSTFNIVRHVALY